MSRVTYYYLYGLIGLIYTAMKTSSVPVLLRILHERELEGICVMLLFADIFYNHSCKCIEFEPLTLTDTSTVVVRMFVTDMAHGYSM